MVSSRAKLKLRKDIVARAKPGALLSDGGGLRCRVRSNGVKDWHIRIHRDGRYHDLGLGSFPEPCLPKAREAAAAKLAELAIAMPAIRQRTANSFDALTVQFLASQSAGWKGTQYANDMRSMLARYASPVVGKLDVAHIRTEHILAIVQPIWEAKPVAARRLLQRIEAVLNYATAKKCRTGENPARWKGHLALLLSKPKSTGHLAAMDFKAVPAFYKQLEAIDTVASRALRWTILTGCRTAETRGAVWSEIDLENQLWTIPGNRMKAGREHTVPLTPAMIALLGPPSTGPLFAGSSTGGTLGSRTLIALLQRMGHDVTAHGFRSCLRTWATECTNHPREVAEHCLAHAVGSVTERSYSRGTMLAKRRDLLTDWASYLAS